MKAIYPGSFDPITYGHLDIIDRASKVFEELVIVIMINDEKSGTFSIEERKIMVEEAVKHHKNVSVCVGEGLTVDFARKLAATVLVRGIRAVTDYEYEMQLATTNMTLNPNVHTVFFVAQPRYSFLSSSTAKTIAKNHGDISAFVPENVEKELKKKYSCR